MTLPLGDNGRPGGGGTALPLGETRPNRSGRRSSGGSFGCDRPRGGLGRAAVRVGACTRDHACGGLGGNRSRTWLWLRLRRRRCSSRSRSDCRRLADGKQTFRSCNDSIGSAHRLRRNAASAQEEVSAQAQGLLRLVRPLVLAPAPGWAPLQRAGTSGSAGASTAAGASVSAGWSGVAFPSDVASEDSSSAGFGLAGAFFAAAFFFGRGLLLGRRLLRRGLLDRRGLFGLFVARQPVALSASGHHVGVCLSE